MSRQNAVATKQLMLTLERESGQRLPAEIREKLIKALADLLLEALGDESGEQRNPEGGGHESED